MINAGFVRCLQVNATLRPHTLNSTYVELVPGGIKQDVTEENKCEYVQTLAKVRSYQSKFSLEVLFASLLSIRVTPVWIQC